MAIIQGSNAPLIISFDEFPAISKLSVGLYQANGELLKQWHMEDVKISNGSIACPLTQEETAAMPEGHAFIEVKLAGLSGEIIFYERENTLVARRYDKGVIL